MPKLTLDKGILIAIEGIDGAGKTSQTIRLRKYFEALGFDVDNFKEPTDGPYGKEIKELAIHGRNSVTPEHELELFLKDRAEDCEKNIKPALDKNKLVFLDRYYFSSVAYQGALGLDKNDILRRNEEIAIVPDLTIIIDVAVKIGLSRIEKYRKEKHNHFEKANYLEKVRRLFLEMKMPNIQIIDGSRDEETVFNNLKNIVTDIIVPHAFWGNRPYKDVNKNFRANETLISEN